MLKRIVILPLTLIVIAASSIAASAQPATPGVEDVVDDHLAWVLSLFDDGAAGLTSDEVEARFDSNFLGLVSTEEFIVSVQQMAETLGPLELVEAQREDPNEFIGEFESESGLWVQISFVVDPATGLMSGFFITPVPGPAPSGTPVATPHASPVAAGSPVVDDPAAQIALYKDITSRVREVSEPVIQAVLAGDDAALEPYLSAEMAAALGTTSIADVIDAFTTRQVQMVFDNAGASFFGQWNGDEISGVMVQGGVPYQFTLAAEEPQTGDLPAGRWTGSIPQAQLEIGVEFGTDDENGLTATLDIPAQGVDGQPLTGVQYLPERPVGDQVNERVFVPGGLNTSHTVDLAWGDHLLRVVVGVDVESGEVTALRVLPAIPTSPAPDTPEAQATYHLPFEGLWWVYWGGETELHNYHAATPSQRYAYDLVIWKDGATHAGDGATNGDYWAWGQAVYAPAGGTVISVENGVPDNDPSPPTMAQGDPTKPAGNHVVIETAEGEYLFVAHLQQGSAQVEVGDEVSAGDVLGLTGNSGNSSEPHIHIHVQDTADVLDFGANGIPLAFESAVVDGESRENAIPLQGSFIAPE